MAVLRRIRDTLPAFKPVSAGTLSKPKRRPLPSFSGNGSRKGRR